MAYTIPKTSTPPMASGVSAQELYADMSRKQWQDYLTTFVPIENQLIQYAMDPETVTNAVANAREDVSAQFGARQGMLDRQMRGFGTTLDPEQKAASDREFGLQKSLADVSAVNTTTAMVKARQMGIMGGPAPNPNDPGG